jgi:hypothetical protein
VILKIEAFLAATSLRERLLKLKFIILTGDIFTDKPVIILE